MTLTISSPLKTETLMVQALEVNALSGNMIILDGHAPSLIILKPQSSVAWTLPSGAVIKQDIEQGILQVERTSVLLLLNQQI